jgi:hypothetical protein
MITTEIRFTTCTPDMLEEYFDLRQTDYLPSLDAWLSIPAHISDFERQSLLYYQQALVFNVQAWHETELHSHFIGPIFALVNFSTYDFNHFEERDLSAVVDTVRLYGRPDGIVASGRWNPKTPYFAFQEYKRLTDPNGNPLGQCLGAMLAGQALNNDGLPIYGCFVIGDRWQFVTLEGRQFAINPGYLATTNDLFDIFRILKALKQLVIERTS